MKTMMMKLLGMAVAVLALCQHSSAQNDDDPNGPREPGVAIRMYQIDKQINKMRPLVKGQTPNISKVVPLLDLSDSRDDFKPMEEFFLLNATGFLDVPADGKYEFELTSDDGSILYLNNHEVVNNDFEHSAKAVRGSVDLKKGLVPLEVKFFQGVGNAVLTLKWKTPGAKDFVVVPTSALSCPEGEVRVTSPGVKQIITPLERGRPGDGQPLEGVHPSFTLAQARPDSFHPRVGGIDWLSDGRMVLCLWDADGSVFLLKGAEGNDPEKIEVKRIGAGLAEPLGIKVLHQDGKDHIYVLQKQELTELIDHDGDDIIDEYRCVCNGWNVSANFHEFAFGLVYKDGCFYGNLAIAINPGGRSTKPQVQERGSVMRIHPDGRYEIIANGLRAPNGIGIGVDGEIFVSDNQGDWLPSSKIMHVKEGAFYGQEAVLGDKAKGLKVTPPVVWLPQGEIGNSPSEVTAINIGPWKGQMIHSDVTHGGLKRVFAEKIDGDYQGCVFRFTQGLEAGINRVRFGPDGAIYVGGIGSTGDWGQEG
ncbi:MAG TPA: PA14 domain-containing protein, partial [Phycisphaerales bacterium]|nr:PA14 domain-containing protein [Phycisphaerales bacterium]